jgi:60 kDa SS-A/Ro ribonucleoprotein
VPNSAGGHAFPVDDWERLDRFPILGAEGGSCHAGKLRLTRESARAVERCLAADGGRAVRRIAEISASGRASSNDPALFALALAAAAPNAATRRAALDALPQVARTATHLFHFVACVGGFRGRGRALRRAIADWHRTMPVEALVHQAVKYRQRDGWTHRDLLRLAHPLAAAEDEARRAPYDWIRRGTDAPALPTVVRAAGRLAATRDAGEAAALIRAARLVHEAVPTELLGEPEVWAALLDDMPLGTLVRSLARMTEIGLLRPTSDAAAAVEARLADAAALRRARAARRRRAGRPWRSRS